MADPRWLLLAHQLPTRASNARVKTWRRLNQIGAVAVRNSLYVLPNTEQCREDFEWLRGEIAALGGEASIFAADTVGASGAEEIVRAFQAARAADYRHLARQARTLAAACRSQRRARPAARSRLSRSIRALRDRFAALQSVDFFTAPGRQDAARAIEAVDDLLAGPRSPLSTSSRLSAADYQNRRWVTRPRPGVDRMASAWLIRRFIDPAAVFAFAEHPQDGDVAFDMYGGEFSHDGPHCTFETLVNRFGFADGVVARIGQIVHDLDMKEVRFALPEAPGIGRMVEGLRRNQRTDTMMLEQGIAMFEALAQSFEASDEAKPRRPGRATKRGKTRSGGND
jgi:hypothetical protein